MVVVFSSNMRLDGAHFTVCIVIEKKLNCKLSRISFASHLSGSERICPNQSGLGEDKQAVKRMAMRHLLLMPSLMRLLWLTCLGLVLLPNAVLGEGEGGADCGNLAGKGVVAWCLFSAALGGMFRIKYCNMLVLALLAS